MGESIPQAITAGSNQVAPAELLGVAPIKHRSSTDLGRRIPPWRSALSILVVLVRNVVVTSVVACMTAFCCSRGSIVHSTAPELQPRNIYRTALMMWTLLVSGIFHVIVHSYRLVSQRFAHMPLRRPGFAYCVRRVVEGMLAHFVVAAAAMLGLGVSLGYLPNSWAICKFEYYVGCAISVYLYSACDAAARFIYSNETLEGQQKARERPHHRRWATYSVVRVFRAYRHNLHLLVSLLVAGGFIHLISRLMFAHTIDTTVFYFVSLAIKLSMQEAAKVYLWRAKIFDIRQMSIIIGFPTVLIDTQVRVVVLHAANTQSTLLSTCAMAAIEILVRLGKALWLKMWIRAKKQKVGTARSLTVPLANVVPTQERTTTNPNPSTASSIRSSGWLRHVHAMHTAEVYADMYAEYIAIGCAAAILLFFSGHAQFRLGTTETSTTKVHPLVSLAYQGGIELVVDFVACIIEIRQGIHMQISKSLGGFLGFFFTMSAVVNVNTSALLYTT